MGSLGRLERVELNEAWATEAGDFTPWLARPENLALLGETIDLELEPQSTEHPVGPFRADILCKDIATDHFVLIENQLAKTDHSHLGQILTYAAGLQTLTIVWIAREFTSEHRAALDWLNKVTDETINFFGLELELWRIGNSPPAPKFNIVSKPNDWVRYIRESASHTELTDTRDRQLRFWEAFREFLKGHPVLKCQKPLPQNWMNFSIGRSGFHMSAVISTWSDRAGWDLGEIRALLLVNTGDNTKEYFALLESQREEIEREFGESLIWRNPPDKRQSMVVIQRPADVLDESKWPQHMAWLKEKLEGLHRVLAKRVKSLELP